MAKSSTREVGMQVPGGHYPEVPTKGALWKDSSQGRANSSGAVPARRHRVVGRQSDAGPRAHAAQRTTKYGIAHTIGYLKGKSAVRIHRNILGTRGTLFRRSFCSRGYCISTVGWDEEGIRRYIREQEKLQKEQEQLGLDLN